MPPRKKAPKKKVPPKKVDPVIDVIDLSSSPPQAAPPPTTLSGKPTPDLEQNPEPEDYDDDGDDYESDPPAEPLEVPLPNLTDLATQYPDHDDLYEHLISIPRPILANMLLSHIPDPTPARGKRKSKKPKAKPELAHCVYCHKIYNTHNNSGCKIRHWGDFDTDDEEFTCCGLYVYWESDNPARAPPEVDQPWCYEGPHWDVEVCSDDEEDGAWWKEWEESGMTCKDLGCEKKLNRMMGEGRE